MAQRYEYQDIEGHVILLFVHPAKFQVSGSFKFLVQLVFRFPFSKAHNASPAHVVGGRSFCCLTLNFLFPSRVPLMGLSWVILCYPVSGLPLPFCLQKGFPVIYAPLRGFEPAPARQFNRV